MADGIEFDLSGIARELSQHLLAVPVYQRSYAWSKERVGEFWSDIKGAFVQGAKEYFLGTIVLTREGDHDRDMIVDGQQRLATTSMFLAAVRDHYKANGDTSRANIIETTFLTTSDLKSGGRFPRLRLNGEDDGFYRRHVVETIGAKPDRESHERIASAYQLLRDEVAKFSAEAGNGWANRLYDLVTFVKERVRAIFLEVPTEADAFLLFETMNDRGADLTVADLLKNYLFGKAGQQLDTVREGWLQAVGALEISLENAIFTTFLRQYWSSRKGEAVRERELYRSIRDSVASDNQSVDFVDDLQRGARFYAALLNSDHEFWGTLGTNAKDAIETYLRLELIQVRPLMLAAMQHFAETELKSLVRSLVNWGVRGLIVGGIGGGTYERAYCVAASKVRKGEIKGTKDVLADLDNVIPSDEEFRSAFEVAKVPRSVLARYYLRALENGRQGVSEPEFVPNADEEQINLEHVLPKNAANGEWDAQFNADQRKEWTFRLGNLALLQKGPNGRIGNKPFSVKRPLLAASGFKTTAQIGLEADWTPAEAGARQKTLAALAISVWPRT